MMNKFFIRLFDIVFALLGLIIFFPFFILISIWILLDSSGGIFFKQERVGKNGKSFFLWKLRTMKANSDKNRLITVGIKDSRITRSGYFLRRYKLDEMPQLLNVLKGEMSLVGPRPEVRKYVELYSADQRKVLTVKPGITDFASIEYSNESEILGRYENPDKAYIEHILPAKLSLNMKFIDRPTLSNYFLILLKTFTKIFG